MYYRQQDVLQKNIRDIVKMIMRNIGDEKYCEGKKLQFRDIVIYMEKIQIRVKVKMNVGKLWK